MRCQEQQNREMTKKPYAKVWDPVIYLLMFNLPDWHCLKYVKLNNYSDFG